MDRSDLHDLLPDQIPGLLRYARTIVWDEAAAEDLVSDTLVRALERSDSYRGDSSLSTWLHRIVVNACLDRIRANKVRRAVPLPDHTDDAALAEPHDRIDEHTTRMTVQAALAQLPPDQRVAITLVDLEGWAVDDAAEILECPPGTVKSRCHRGRARLYDLLRNPSDPQGVPRSGGDPA